MPRKKLKIAIFHFAFIYSGGGERLVLEEAIRLSELGHEVTCFAPVVNKKNCFPELIEKVKVEKILPRILPKWYPDNILLSILAACVFIPFFFYKFRKYDIYFGANQPGPWISYVLSKINKKPYVIYLAQPTRLVHPRLIDHKVGLKLVDGFTLLGLFTNLSKPFIRYLDGLSIRGAQVVFANGSYMTGVLKEVYGIEPINCPAGANMTKFPISNFSHKGTSFFKASQFSKRFKGSIILNGFRVKKPYVLITNRHFQQKKFEYAIEAMSLLDRKVNIVITGRLTDYTRKLVKQYGKNSYLHFVGLLSEAELERVYEQAAVYVYPAPEEDFGMGIVEAMAHGVPVVAWGNAGPTGIITHGRDGLLARPFDIADYASQIQRLLDDRIFYERISSQAREKIERGFSYRGHVAMLEKYMIKSYCIFFLIIYFVSSFIYS
jgi:glycosyltransferase involved in cell wall biosynthesis